MEYELTFWLIQVYKQTIQIISKTLMEYELTFWRIQVYKQTIQIISKTLMEYELTFYKKVLSYIQFYKTLILRLGI